jgi:isocitrate dehydrogenase kinase/phosphatase
MPLDAAFWYLLYPAPVYPEENNSFILPDKGIHPYFSRSLEGC